MIREAHRVSSNGCIHRLLDTASSSSCLLTAILLFVITVTVSHQEDDNLDSTSTTTTTTTATTTKVDSDNFCDLMFSNVYVDKSLMIDEFLRHSRKINLIVRPKGWGKTTNLKMLKTFLETEIDDNYKPIQKADSVNIKYFAGGIITTVDGNTRELKALKIAGCTYSMEKQGSYPVLYVSFKNVTGRNYSEIVDSTRRHVMRLYSDQYGYLNAKGRLNAERRDKFVAYATGNVTDLDLYRCVEFLSKLLYNRYKNQTVIVLVDDYDAPINSMWSTLEKHYRAKYTGFPDWIYFHKTAKSKEFRQSKRFLRNILGECFTDNEAVEKALVTGTFPLTLSDPVLEGVRDITQYTVLNKEFSEFYGFSQDEVELSLEKMTIKTRELVKDWYGYNFTDNAIAYNPWSITHFSVNKHKCENYWIRCTDASIADYLLASDYVQPDIQQLVDGETVESEIYNKVRYARLTDDLGIFLYSGYLNPISTDETFNRWKLNAPNEEVKTIFKRKIVEWTCRKLNMRPNDFVVMTRMLAEFKIADLEASLRTHLLEAPAIQNHTKEDELICSGILRGLAYSFGDEYIVNTHKKPETDKVTMMVMAKRKAIGTAFILEGTITRNPDNLVQQAKEELQQLHYVLDGFIRRRTYIKEILKFSLVIYGKEIGVIHRIETS